jgi:hypothetical protein
VTLIDFVSGAVEDWRDARIEAFAPDFDGALWFVAEPGGLIAVETTTGGFDGAWAAPLPGPALAIARSQTHCSLLVASQQTEVWTYELPSLTLRHREAIPQGLSGLLGISPDGTLAEAPAGSHSGPPAAAGDWTAFPLHGKQGVTIHLLHRPSGAARAEVVLERATRVTLHLTPQALTLADDRGRVLVLDLEYGQVRRDLRL